MSIETLAEEARHYEQQAEERENEAEDYRWLAAQRYYEAVKVEKCAPGMFAKLVGRNTKHVRCMWKTWEQHGEADDRDATFWEYYELAERTKPRPQRRRGPAENLSEEDSTSADDADDEAFEDGEPEENDDPAAPPPTHTHRILQVSGQISQARSYVGKALSTARLAGVLADDEKIDILHRLDRVEEVIGWLRSYVSTGDRSFDEQLQELLSESQ